ncbi:unnamed protein product, partial [Meganyctiphanes norvegica]
MDNTISSPALAAAITTMQLIEQHDPHQQQQLHEIQQHHPQFHAYEDQKHEHLQLNEQQQEQQIFYKSNELGSNWDNHYPIRQHQTQHFNLFREVNSQSPLNTIEKGPTTSVHHNSTSTNSDYIPNNFLSFIPGIPERYAPEPCKKYPPEQPNSYDLESTEMYKPQPYTVYSSQLTKAYNEDPQENCVNLKNKKFELINEQEMQSDKHTDNTVMGVNSENSFLNIEHSIFQNKVEKTQDIYASDDSVDSVDSYMHKSDNSNTEEEIKKNISYLESKLKENINLLKSLNTKRPPKVQQRKQCHNKVETFTDNLESQPDDDSIIMHLIAETTPMLDVIRWFQHHQLLKSEIKCDHCEHIMYWKTDLEMKRYKEGFHWKCENKSCPKFYCRKNIKIGSVFERSRICLKKWLHIIYKWSKNVGVTAASEQINIDCKTMGQCYSFFREICEQYFRENPIKLGGPGITIEFNVFSLSDLRKRNHGTEPQSPIWILAIVDINCIPTIGYMEIVESANVSTLLPIIIKVVQPGSIIHSKEWITYRKIQGISDMVKTMDHCINFVDVDCRIHSQTIESYWKKHKTCIMTMRGIKKSVLKSHIQEFMWRERFSDNVFEILCEQISVQYSNDTFIHSPDKSYSMEEEN